MRICVMEPSSTFRWLILYTVVLVPCSHCNEHVPCDDLAIEHGAVYRTTDATLGDVILLECHDNFLLQGSSQLECIDDMISSSQLPACLATARCVVDFTLEHGTVTNNEPLITGETVQFSCDEHYTLSTSYSSITCISEGSFNKPPPFCVSSGKSCTLSKGLKKTHFLASDSVGMILHGQTVQIGCEHGYFMKNPGNISVQCLNGKFTTILDDLCTYVGFSCTIKNGSQPISKEMEPLEFDKGSEVNLTCLVRSKTSDGLPLPEITWMFPPKLRDYVAVDDTDTFVHTTYINSVWQKYSTVYNVKGGYYEAQGVLQIHPTMDVHNGAYTCHVRLVNVTDTSCKTMIKIRTKYELAMYCLIALPVVLFLAIHCFYRKATTINPFPGNKLTRHMMQEHEKKKKLDELRNLHRNPVYQKTPNSGQARRGAVIDL